MARKEARKEARKQPAVPAEQACSDNDKKFISHSYYFAIAIAVGCVAAFLFAPNRVDKLAVKFTSPEDIFRQAAPRSEALHPGGLHIVDNFLSDDEVDYLRKSLDMLGPWNPTEELNRHSQYFVNGAYMKECALMCETVVKVAGLEKACPVCPVSAGPVPLHPAIWTSLLPNATVDDDHVAGRVLRRVLHYANRFIRIQGTLVGRSEYTGKVFFDHGNVRRNTVHDIDHTGVNIHIDSDIDSRCLSAAITLTDHKPGEGIFRVYGCPLGEEDKCLGLQGDNPQAKGKLVYKGVLAPQNQPKLRLLNEAATARSRIVYFLSETPHAVTPIRDDRDVFFVWMACSPFLYGQGDLEGRNAASLARYLSQQSQKQ